MTSQPISLLRGQNHVATIRVELGGAPLDLSTASAATFIAKPSEYSPAVKITKTLGSGVAAGATGSALITITTSDAAALDISESYSWTLTATIDGTAAVVARGVLTAIGAPQQFVDEGVDRVARDAAAAALALAPQSATAAAAAAVAEHNDRVGHAGARVLRGSAAKLNSIAAGTVAQYRIASIGDSISWQKPSCIFSALAGSLNIAGQFGQPVPSVAGGASIKSTGVDPDFAVYPNGDHVVLPSGGSVVYTATGGHPTGPTCDTIECLYAKGPSGGVIKLQTSQRAGAFADEAGYTAIDTYSSTVSLGRITLTKAVDAWRARWVGVSGTSKVVYPIFKNSTIKGCTFFPIAAGGATLSQILQCEASGVLSQLYTIAPPDLIIIENKETAESMRQFLPILTGIITTAAPAAEIILVGSNPVASGDSAQVEQNEFVKAHAATIGAHYFDAYAVAGGSYAEFVRRGYSFDGTHPKDNFHELCAGIILRDIVYPLPAGFVSAPLASGTIPGLPKGRMPKAGNPPFAIDDNGLRLWSYCGLGTGIYREARIASEGGQLNFFTWTNEGPEGATTCTNAVSVASYGAAHGRILFSGATTEDGLGGIQWPYDKTGQLAGLGWGATEGFYKSADGMLAVAGADMSILKTGGALYMKSPNGAMWKITVSNGGALVVASA